MSSPHRTTYLPPASVAIYEMLVSPPLSGSSATLPCQQDRRSIRSASARFSMTYASLPPFWEEPTMPDARVTNTITGRDAFLRVLSDEGVVKMFRSEERRVGEV